MSGAETTLTIDWTTRVLEALTYYQLQIAASAMIGLALGVLGVFVVLRRMALIGDALSHAILPGVVLAYILLDAIVGHLEGFWGVWGLFLGALIAGLVTAFGIGWVTKYARAKEDTAIGIVFTAMFGLGVILISLQPKGTHFDLACFLFGLPLAIGMKDFISISIITPLVLLYLILGYRGLKMLSFDSQMAMAIGVRTTWLHYVFMGFLAATVVAALNTVGVIMSVAMLVTPAAAAYQLTNRLSWMLVLSGLFGAMSAVVGFLAAFALNIPTGPAMVLAATFLFGLTFLFAPEYGMLSRSLRRRSVQIHMAEEDVLVALARASEPLSLSALRASLQADSAVFLSRSLKNLKKARQIRKDANGVSLTESGVKEGRMLLRSHRIWEAYLAKNRIAGEAVHPTAEKLEHAHELAEVLAQELGNPDRDPHGQPIPKANGSD